MGWTPKVQLPAQPEERYCVSANAPILALGFTQLSIQSALGFFSEGKVART